VTGNWPLTNATPVIVSIPSASVQVTPMNPVAPWKVVLREPGVALEGHLLEGTGALGNPSSAWSGFRGAGPG
jgi:hypothetical protein